MATKDVKSINRFAASTGHITHWVYFGDDNKLARMLASLLTTVGESDTVGRPKIDFYSHGNLRMDGISNRFISRIQLNRDAQLDKLDIQAPFIEVQEICNMREQSMRIIFSHRPEMDMTVSLANLSMSLVHDIYAALLS